MDARDRDLLTAVHRQAVGLRAQVDALCLMLGTLLSDADDADDADDDGAGASQQANAWPTFGGTPAPTPPPPPRAVNVAPLTRDHIRAQQARANGCRTTTAADATGAAEPHNLSSE